MLEPIPKDEYSSFNTLTFAQSVDSAEQMMVGLSLATACSFITRLEFHRARSFKMFSSTWSVTFRNYDRFRLRNAQWFQTNRYLISLPNLGQVTLSYSSFQLLRFNSRPCRSLLRSMAELTSCFCYAMHITSWHTSHSYVSSFGVLR